MHPDDRPPEARGADYAEECFSIGDRVRQLMERHPDALRVEVYGKPGRLKVIVVRAEKAA